MKDVPKEFYLVANLVSLLLAVELAGEKASCSVALTVV